MTYRHLIRLLTISFEIWFVVCQHAAAVTDSPAVGDKVKLHPRHRIAVVGNSLAERMNLFGHFETRLHTRYPDKELIFRNFGWPADEVGRQQRPSSYTTIDDPLDVFGPELFICFFGFNESFSGSDSIQIQEFAASYRKYIDRMSSKFSKDDGKTPRFILVSPIAFEATEHALQPSGVKENQNLAAFSTAVAKLAEQDGHFFVDLFEDSRKLFAAELGNQYTINGVHLNEKGDAAIARILEQKLFGDNLPQIESSTQFQNMRRWVNDKSWFHSQDYRMLNGWYVYGGRRTWDTETFPTEYRKIRNIVAVRDQYIWDLAAGRDVLAEPDDSKTGEVFEPTTMYGTRDDNFREMREPKLLKYPTPEESIEMMTVPAGFQVELFASEREFPQLANPNQIAFDNRGRLWVSCMVNYPQWQPGSAKPNDRLLILEDTNNDGVADKCTAFYDKLICPTGFEFWNGGVLVVDEPRVLFLPNDQISKSYETISILTIDGQVHSGFVLKEDGESISIGISDGKQIDIPIEDIEMRKEMKASSMPEGLIKQIAPIEFLDLIAFLENQTAISARTLPGGWIKASSDLPVKLREHKGLKEISRDAAVKLDESMTNPDWHGNAHLFLTEAVSRGADFAFHSAHDANNPRITIELADESEVRHIWLQNRLDSQFHERANGITIWTSLDGELFQKAWSATNPQAEWMVDLPAGTRAKFLRIGLEGTGTFHLNRAAVYGQ